MSLWRWLVAPALIAAVAAALHGAPSARAAFVDSDGDGVIDVAELIADSDPDDPASGPESIGGGIYLNQPFCTDGIDNDLDGDTDAADAGCVDSDGDLADDPVEIAFGSDPNNMASLPEHSMVDAMLAYLGFLEGFCGNGFDDDLDGLFDEADPGCAPFDSDGDGFEDVPEKLLGSDPYVAGSVPEDEAANPGSCIDGQDNDGDGLTDIGDPACAGVPTPTPVTPTATGGPTAQAPTPTATPPAVAGLPASGAGPGRASAGPWLIAGLAAAGALLGAGSALRARRR
jgi:hypothetical protein